MKTFFTTFGLIGLGMVFSTCDSIKHCDAYTFQSSKVIQCDELYPEYNCDRKNTTAYSSMSYIPYYNSGHISPLQNPAIIHIYPADNTQVINRPRQNTQTYSGISQANSPIRKPRANKEGVKKQ